MQTLTANQMLKKHYDKENIFQSIEKAMEEYHAQFSNKETGVIKHRFLNSFCDWGDPDKTFEWFKPYLSVSPLKEDQITERECLIKIKEAIRDKGCCGNAEKIGLLVDFALSIPVQEQSKQEVSQRVAITALEKLIALKDYKDKNGKNDYYETNKTITWEFARKALLISKKKEPIEECDHPKEFIQNGHHADQPCYCTKCGSDI